MGVENYRRADASRVHERADHMRAYGAALVALGAADNRIVQLAAKVTF